MTYNEEQIKSDIIAHIRKGGGSYGDWYVGITKDPRDRLFNGHAVNKDDAWWIYRQATNSDVARAVERYLVNVLRADGGTGGGDNTADFVYAYKKTLHTNP